MSSGHSKNKRRSTKDKHDDGQGKKVMGARRSDRTKRAAEAGSQEAAAAARGMSNLADPHLSGVFAGIEITESRRSKHEVCRSPVFDTLTRHCNRVRERLAQVCEEVIQTRLPLGSTRRQIIDVLGEPAGETDDVLYYYGKDIGWLHKMEIRGGKLTKHYHGRAFDFES